jgi:glycosyltransferase involved in cell wall biosynthesis
MRILQLCKKFPYPLKDGEAIAVTYLSEALHTLGSEITLLSMNTSKHYFDLSKLPRAYSQYQSIHTVDLDNRVRPWPAFVNLFSRESYHVSRFVSSAFEKKLIRLLKEGDFDVILLESLFLAPYIPAIREHSRALVAMRAHNVEHEIWERVGETTSFPLKRIYLNYLAGKLKRYEIEQLKNYDLLVAITERDEQIFMDLGYQGASLTIPVGLNMNHYQPDPEAFQKVNSLAFIGSLDWMPNQDGVKWFLELVWPEVHSACPGLQFFIAGRNAPPWIRQLRQPGVVFLGEVEDARKFLLAHPIVVVPLLSGSGIRVKIIESMALGRAVVSTTVGLEGIRAKGGEEVCISDDPVEMAGAICSLVQTPGKALEVGKAAYSFIHGNFDNQALGEKLLHTMQKYISPQQKTSI